jgi:[acyl-carrier-protein] S-malonyltransferase
VSAPAPVPPDATAATVAGEPVLVAEVDAREARLRASELAGALAGALPAAGTSEGRQLRRWLTQLLVTERVIAVEAARRGADPHAAPTEPELLPDTTARLELGSVVSAVLTSSALARALFAALTADITITEDEVAAYHARNPYRFAAVHRNETSWDAPASKPPPLHAVRAAIAADLLRAAQRRAFATWMDGRRAELVQLAPGYEHPGDPRQPDNTHRH